MNRKQVVVSVVLILVGGSLVAGLGGCIGEVGQNLTKERTGNITMVFINNTPYRAVFSFGTWDEWDRTPGAVTMQQLGVDAYTSTGPATLPCRRNAAIGTQDFVDRVVATDADDTVDFEPDFFDTVVRFSRAPSDTDPAGMPTEGTALGIEVLLGVDYSCEDQLVFTFVQDPQAEGGFRIDYEVILDDVQGS